MTALRLAALLLVVSCGGNGAESQRLLDDLSANGGPTPLKAAAPQVQHEALAAGGDVYRAYESGMTPMLLLARYGRPLDEARIVSFAQSMARARFEVIVPADDGRYLPAEESGPALQRALQATSGKAVIVAFSASVAPALRLAEDARDRVAGIVAIGGVADTASAWRDLWSRAPRSAWRSFGAISDAAAPRRDRVLLSGIAMRKAQDPAAPIDDLKRQVSPEGLRFLALAMSDAHEVPVLLDLAPLTKTACPVLILNGADDPFAPSTGSLGAALGAGPDKIFQFDSLVNFRADETSLHDRRLWLKAISIVLDWRS